MGKVFRRASEGGVVAALVTNTGGVEIEVEHPSCPGLYMGTASGRLWSLHDGRRSVLPCRLPKQNSDVQCRSHMRQFASSSKSPRTTTRQRVSDGMPPQLSSQNTLHPPKTSWQSSAHSYPQLNSVSSRTNGLSAPGRMEYFYYGETKHSKRHGWGVLVSNRRVLYEGQWQAGRAYGLFLVHHEFSVEIGVRHLATIMGVRIPHDRETSIVPIMIPCSSKDHAHCPPTLFAPSYGNKSGTFSECRASSSSLFSLSPFLGKEQLDDNEWFFPDSAVEHGRPSQAELLRKSQYGGRSIETGGVEDDKVLFSYHVDNGGNGYRAKLNNSDTVSTVPPCGFCQLPLPKRIPLSDGDGLTAKSGQTFLRHLLRRGATFPEAAKVESSSDGYLNMASEVHECCFDNFKTLRKSILTSTATNPGWLKATDCAKWTTNQLCLFLKMVSLVREAVLFKKYRITGADVSWLDEATLRNLGVRNSHTRRFMLALFRYLWTCVDISDPLLPPSHRRISQNRHRLPYLPALCTQLVGFLGGGGYAKVYSVCVRSDYDTLPALDNNDPNEGARKSFEGATSLGTILDTSASCKSRRMKQPILKSESGASRRLLNAATGHLSSSSPFAARETPYVHHDREKWRVRQVEMACKVFARGHVIPDPAELSKEQPHSMSLFYSTRRPLRKRAASSHIVQSSLMEERADNQTKFRGDSDGRDPARSFLCKMYNRFRRYTRVSDYWFGHASGGFEDIDSRDMRSQPSYGINSSRVDWQSRSCGLPNSPPSHEKGISEPSVCCSDDGVARNVQWAYKRQHLRATCDRSHAITAPPILMEAERSNSNCRYGVHQLRDDYTKEMHTNHITPSLDKKQLDDGLRIVVATDDGTISSRGNTEVSTQVAPASYRRPAIGAQHFRSFSSAKKHRDHEANVLSCILPHKNVLTVHAKVDFDDNTAGLLLEYCQKGSLDEYIFSSPAHRHSPRSLSRPQVIKLFEDVARGMAHVHACGVLHRDIKLSNLLIDSSDVGKIADFGISTPFAVEESPSILAVYGSVFYAAPEVLRGDGFYPASDVWSYGVALWEALTRRVAYEGLSAGAVYTRQAAGQLRLPIPVTLPPKLGELLGSLLQPNHLHRPNFQQVAQSLSTIRSESNETMMTAVQHFFGIPSNE